jgi:hypothetical protein
MGLASYSTYYEFCILERITKMKGRVEEQLQLAFAFVITKLGVFEELGTKHCTCILMIKEIVTSSTLDNNQ